MFAGHTTHEQLSGLRSLASDEITGCDTSRHTELVRDKDSMFRANPKEPFVPEQDSRYVSHP